MHLVACPRPQEPLEDAPRTALLADLTEGERWEGFWSSDSYFVRCTKSGGEVEWFKLADDVAADGAGRPTSTIEARVLPFRGRGVRTGAHGRVAVLVAKSPDGRGMLVGTAQRGSRSGSRSGGRRSGE
jgi:hypothetical protein